MKKSIILLIIFSTILTIFFVYKNFFEPVKIVEIRDTSLDYLKSDTSKIYNESKEWYDIKVKYPEKNKIVTDIIFNTMNDFVLENDLRKYDNSKDAREALGIQDSAITYAFSADYTIATSSETITYLYNIYSFTGGAHGSASILPITLDNKGNILTVEKILPTEQLPKVSQLAKIEILKLKNQRYKENGMKDKEIKEYLKNDTFMEEGLKPTRDNYNAVWLDGENLIIHFGQYQVGPYAEGMYDIKIPISEVK